ncbi:hypothetical protein CDD80_2237 [Ophiocordyceps camponoti-rufipedis]|uniref:Uncharacterized protein n=1 Tax=Ophiocordyceps camponoti-rufipedis TaxID=2004952 RepID=A0A2C5Z1A4_9HYPO|nr:hypothetical protein CDD80_2237 [Ophiocordyceps camponoti-rufipedis]
MAKKRGNKADRRASLTPKKDNTEQTPTASSSSLSSSSSSSSSPELDTYLFRLCQGSLLQEYQDETRHDLMEVVERIETEATTMPTDEQRGRLVEAVVALADAHARRGASAEDLTRLMAAVRKKMQEAIDGKGLRGTPFGKLIVWYERELEKVRRKNGEGKRCAEES